MDPDENLISVESIKSTVLAGKLIGSNNLTQFIRIPNNKTWSGRGDLNTIRGKLKKMSVSK
jgi:hypothetical protein